MIYDPGVGPYLIVPGLRWLSCLLLSNLRSTGGVGLSTSRGVVSTRNNSVFIPWLLEFSWACLGAVFAYFVLPTPPRPVSGRTPKNTSYASLYFHVMYSLELSHLPDLLGPLRHHRAW